MAICRASPDRAYFDGEDSLCAVPPIQSLAQQQIVCFFEACPAIKSILPSFLPACHTSASEGQTTMLYFAPLLDAQATVRQRRAAPCLTEKIRQTYYLIFALQLFQTGAFQKTVQILYRKRAKQEGDFAALRCYHKRVVRKLCFFFSFLCKVPLRKLRGTGETKENQSFDKLRPFFPRIYDRRQHYGTKHDPIRPF